MKRRTVYLAQNVAFCLESTVNANTNEEHAVNNRRNAYTAFQGDGSSLCFLAVRWMSVGFTLKAVMPQALHSIGDAADR